MVLMWVRKSQAIRQSATQGETRSAFRRSSGGKATRLGIRTTIGPMTGLPRQRRLKWIETLKTHRLPAWQVVNKHAIVLIQYVCVNEWLFLTVLSRARFF